MSEFVSSFASSILLSAIGPVAIFLGYRLRQIHLNRKYQITGRYLSKFEDENADGRFVAKSTHRIKQRGGRFIGTDEHSDGRIWRLEGRIFSGGRLGGVYFAELADDDGVGSFYFSKEGADLKGWWGGYDHRNKTTTTGRYILTRKASPKLRKLNRSQAPEMARLIETNEIFWMGPPSETDVESAVAISEQTLGPDYISKQSFDIPYGKPVCLGARDEDSDALIGFCIAYLLKADKFRSVVMEGHAVSARSAEIEHADAAGRLGVIKTVAVSPAVQGRGVGTELVQAAEDRLKQFGATAIVVPAWERGEGRLNIGGVLDHLGYEEWLKAPHFWRTGCDSGSFACPERRPDSPCVCNMRLYRKSV